MFLWAHLRCSVENRLKEGQGQKQGDYVEATAAIHGEGSGTPLQYSCLENPMDFEIHGFA